MFVDTLDERTQLIDRREAGFIGLAFVFILLLAGSLSLSTAARFGRWDYFGDRWGHWIIVPVWSFAYFLLRRGIRRANPTRDPLLLPIPMLFMGWGMLTIWRLDPAFGIRQTGWFILAVCSLYLLLAYGKDLRWIRRYRYLWITLGLFLMFLTLLFGTHPGGGSPRLWLGCCGFYFQPSEALRFLLVAFLAAYLADRLPFEGLSRTGWNLKTWLPLFLIWFLSFSLLIVQRDLGTGMLFMALLTMLLYLVLKRWQVIAIAGVLGLIGGWLGFLLFDVVNIRIQAWLNPFADPLGGSYQIIQSLISVGAGGLFGRGLGLGSPAFVPAIHTDFIFSAMIEEHGLLAGLALIGLWGVWLSRILNGVFKQREPFMALMKAGLAFSLGLQAVLIIGGNLRVFPLVGITLPFTSYGGSSLLISTLSLGVMLLLPDEQEHENRFLKPLQHLQAGMLITLGIAAVFLGWWTLVQGPGLTARGDNPRPAVDSRFSLRGSIYDRDQRVLAETVGSAGAYERIYPQPAASSLVGYDLFPFGRAGLEETLDGILRGVDEVGGWAPVWTYLTRGVSPAGSDVRITLDLPLQRIATDLLAGRRGAIVLIDADTGDLLVAGSSPSYDPNRLSEDWPGLMDDPRSPLINRAIQGQYQPGTALVPFILAKAVEKEWISLDSPVDGLDQAVAVDGEFLYCATSPDPTIPPTFREVLTRGCPAPVQALVQKLGVAFYEDVIKAFRLSVPPGAGQTDDFSARLSQADEVEIAMAAAGQSSLTISPVELVRAFAPFISDGSLPAIRWVDAVRSQDGEWERYGETPAPARILDPASSTEIRESLVRDDAIAYQAQAISGEPLGWFMGGIRGLTGRYAVVVVLEGEGSPAAAEIGVEMLANVNVASIP